MSFDRHIVRAETALGGACLALLFTLLLLNVVLRRINDTLVDCILLVILIMLVATAHSGLATLQTTVALRLPEQWLYAIVPLTMSLCALHIVIRILRRMRGLPITGV